MALGSFLTTLFRPCGAGSAPPKSPVPPSSPNHGECPQPAPIKEEERKGQIVEVTPCESITDKDLAAGTPSPKPADDKAETANDKAFAGSAVLAPNSPADKAAKDKEKKVTSASPRSAKAAKVKLTESATNESEENILKVFGFDILHSLQGKTWDERSQAVQSTRARVVQGDLDSASPEDFWTAACDVAMITLTDKVMPVFFDGLDLTKLLLSEFANNNEISESQINLALEKVVPIIVAKTSDRNARSIEGTRQALVFLSRCEKVGCQPVMAHVLTPIASAKEVQNIRGRLELIHHMIKEFGFSKTSALSLSAVMGFVRPHLDATDEKVRRAAVEVTVACYTIKGERTLKFCSKLKPALFKSLEARFAEVDGVGKKPLPDLRGTKRAHKRGAADRKLDISSPHGSRALPDVFGEAANGASRGSNRNSSSSGSSRQYSRGSGAGSLGSRGKAPLAPLDTMSPSGRLPDVFGNDPIAYAACNGSGSHGSHRQLSELVADDPAALHADLFAANMEEPQMHAGAGISSPWMSSPQPGMSSPQKDPHYIPSPTGMGSDPFSVDADDEAFLMDTNY